MIGQILGEKVKYNLYDHNCSVMAQLLLSPKVCLAAHRNGPQDVAAKLSAKMGIPHTVEGQEWERIVGHWDWV